MNAGIQAGGGPHERHAPRIPEDVCRFGRGSWFAAFLSSRLKGPPTQESAATATTAPEGIQKRPAAPMAPQRVGVPSVGHRL